MAVMAAAVDQSSILPTHMHISFPPSTACRGFGSPVSRAVIFMFRIFPRPGRS